MKALKFFMILIFLGSLFSCHKKDYPQPLVVENSAVYYSNLTIDNKPVVLQAGIDGYYMYSSYKLDSNSVYGFIADLKQTNCSNCTNSLKIQINDYKVSLLNSSSLIDSSLRKAAYPLLAGTPAPKYQVQFSSLTNDASSYEWNFGDNSPVSTIPAPTHTFNAPQNYNVCLTTKSGSSDYYCSSSICNKERIDGSSKSFRVFITADPTSGNTISFSSNVPGNPGSYKYLWSFGDGTTSTKSSFICNYKYRGAYAVTLRVIDALGDTAYASYNAKTLNDNSSCTANYSISAITTIPALLPLSQVIITWTAADGTVYTSNNASQPTTSSFEILSVNEGERNENNQTTKKINAKFNCKLFSGTKSITVNGAEVVISVAYK